MSMVEDPEFWKSLSLPSLHLGRNLSVPVLAPILQNRIPSNSVVAFPAHELGGVGYCIYPLRPSTPGLARCLFADKSARDPEPGPFVKTVDEIVEVRRLQGDIGIEVPNEVWSDAFEKLGPGLQRPHLRAKAATRSPG